MLKRIPKKPGTVLTLKLSDNLYTLAQLRENALMEFFDVRQPSPQWADVDLKGVPIVFCAYAAESRLKPLIVDVVDADRARPNDRPVPRLMLSPIIEPGGKYGANLVELPESLESVKARLLKADLDPDADRQAIYDHELTSMIGDPEKLKKRLLRFFETGINWDDAKSFLFPSIPLPPARVQ